MKVSRELLGYSVTVRNALNRDRALRSRVYNALGDGEGTWEFAVIVCQIVELSGVEWALPTLSNTDDEIRASFTAWQELPIEVGDVVNLALMDLRKPANPALWVDDPKKD